MSRLKTATTALTAAFLVTGIGLAFAQTADQKQPTDPMAAATASPTSEQTPANRNAQTAQTARDTAARQQMQQQMQQQMPQQNLPVKDPAMVSLPADPMAPLPASPPARSATDNSYPASSTMPSNSNSNSNSNYSNDTQRPSTEPAPRADRN